MSEELTPGAQAIRCLQRQMERQRRANTPANYGERVRINRQDKQGLVWKHGKQYFVTRRRKATRGRKLAALHRRLRHEVVALNTIITEQISYQGWLRQFAAARGSTHPAGC